METPARKRCSVCGLVKDVAEFGRSKRAKDGVRGVCKACNRTHEGSVSRPGEPKRMRAKGRTCGQVAGPEWCAEPVHSRGLCRRHYRRVARGLPVTFEGDENVVGETPSGYGVWGVITQTAEGRLICHECGRDYLSLSHHVVVMHSTLEEYRSRHGLTRSTRMISDKTAAAMRGSADRIAPHPEVLRVARPGGKHLAEGARLYRARERAARSRGRDDS